MSDGSPAADLHADDNLGRLPAMSAPPTPASDPEIDALFEELRQMHHVSLRALAARAGRLVVERLYHGDLEAWCARHPDEPGLGRLLDHCDAQPAAGLSAEAFERLMDVYELDCRRAELRRLTARLRRVD